MHITSISTNDSVPIPVETGFEEPTIAAIRAEIRRLDQAAHSSVILSAGEEEHLCVGGGSGQYLVYFTPDNLRFWNLINRGSTRGKTTITVGGQEGEYAGRQLVSLQQAIAAAVTYARLGQMDAELSWEEQTYPIMP